MAWDITKSSPHVLEQLVLVGKIQSFTLSAAVSVTTPTFTAGGANTSVVASATATVTGAKVGDFVWVDPLAAMVANQVFLGAYVSATDTVTFAFGSAANTSSTGAAKTFDVLVGHRS